MFLPFKIEVEEIEELIGENARLPRRFICQDKFPKSDFDNCKKSYSQIIDLEDIGKKVNEEDIKKAIINGSKLEADWFPTKELGKFDVFISHSHNDIDLVKKFAFWLKEVLGLRCFIDTTYWAYVIDLLKKIDNIYSLKSDGLYDYHKRNFTTANVHIMLSMALMKMMDQTECIIFVDSGNSYNNKKGTTLSPWIYEELCFINRLQVKKPERWTDKRELLVEEVRQFSGLQFEYNINIDNLTKLDSSILNRAKNSEEYGEDALDYIYAISDGKRRVNE